MLIVFNTLNELFFVLTPRHQSKFSFKNVFFGAKVCVTIKQRNLGNNINITKNVPVSYCEKMNVFTGVLCNCYKIDILFKQILALDQLSDL